MSDAVLDAYVAAVENNDFGSSYPGVLKREYDFLVEEGLLEPGEPTRWGHYLYRAKLTAPFSREERAMIRMSAFGTDEG